MSLSPTVYRTIVFVDVADFTNPDRNVADLEAVVSGLYEVLHAALTASGVDYKRCEIEDRGDGALIMIPPDFSKSTLIDRLPDRLVAEIRRYNATRVPAARFKLRVAIHAGDIRHNATSWVGPAVNLAARILEAAEVKSAFAQSDRLVALIASHYFYSEVIEQDPGVAPDAYRRIDVSVKTYSGTIWVRLHGEGAPQSMLPVAPSPPAIAQEVVPDDTVLGVVPLGEVDTVRRWLADRDVPHLTTLVARAVGPAIPPPRDGSAWEVFRYLADFNAGPDGVPPALAYLKLLAREVGGEFQATVSAWVDQQTRRLRLTPALDERHANWDEIPDQPHLHLMITAEPDAIDPRRCVVSSWRQDDPLVWPPIRGDVRETTVEELEYQVDDIILDAEQVWAGQAVSVMIEFVLARSLLTLPVFRWRKEHRSGDPRPLAVDYQLGLRSLERMRTTYWHRPWRQRWQTVNHHPNLDQIHPFGPNNGAQRIDAVLSDLRWMGLVMEQPPPPQPEPVAGPDALTAALRAGLPFVCWHPTAHPEDVRKQVDWLLRGESGFSDLPERHRTALLAAPAVPNSGDLVYDLVIMWEDPYRVIDFGPSIPTP